MKKSSPSKWIPICIIRIIINIFHLFNSRFTNIIGWTQNKCTIIFIYSKSN